GQSQPRLASTRHYGSLSMPTFRRRGPPVSKWNGTKKGLQTVAERLESSRGLSESRNLREIAREQSFSVKQRVKISYCARGAEIPERTCLPRSERAPERHHRDCETFSAPIRDAYSHSAVLGGSHFPNVSLWLARRFPGS